MLTVFHNPRLLIYYVEDKRIRIVSFHMLLIVSFLLDIMASTNNTSLSPEMQAQLKHFFKVQNNKTRFFRTGRCKPQFISSTSLNWLQEKGLQKYFSHCFPLEKLILHCDPLYPRGSWFEQTWKYSTWRCFQTSYSFSGKMVF